MGNAYVENALDLIDAISSSACHCDVESGDKCAHCNYCYIPNYISPKLLTNEDSERQPRKLRKKPQIKTIATKNRSRKPKNVKQSRHLPPPIRIEPSLSYHSDSSSVDRVIATSEPWRSFPVSPPSDSPHSPLSVLSSVPPAKIKRSQCGDNTPNSSGYLTVDMNGSPTPSQADDESTQKTVLSPTGSHASHSSFIYIVPENKAIDEDKNAVFQQHRKLDVEYACELQAHRNQIKARAKHKSFV